MTIEHAQKKAADEVVLEAVAVAKNVKDTADRVQERLDRHESKIIEAIKENSDALKAHTAEDLISFKKQEELAKINGEHLSYFNKNLLEVKQMLLDQNTKTETQNKIFTAHMARVEPVLLNFEENNAFIKGLKKRGGWISTGAGVLITLWAAWVIIKEFIINIR